MDDAIYLIEKEVVAPRGSGWRVVSQDLVAYIIILCTAQAGRADDGELFVLDVSVFSVGSVRRTTA